MSFWDIFIEESLQKPWVIKAEGDVPQVEEPKFQKVFVVQSGVTDSQKEMMTKMVVALKLDPSQVVFLCVDEESTNSIESWRQSKTIMFFGNEYPGDFGHSKNWAGHQIVKTHSVAELEKNPSLKKETWAHLKLYGSLK